MDYQITVEADYNDGDYVSQTTVISTLDLVAIDKVVKAIKNFKPYKVTKNDFDWKHDSNWPEGECCRIDLGEKTPKEYYVDSGLITQEEYDTFSEVIPYHEYGIHTITSVFYSHVVTVTNLL